MFPENKIYCGDNLEIMRGMPDESIDLIYLDPPFFSNKEKETIWGDGTEMRSYGDTNISYDDRLGRELTAEECAYKERHSGGIAHYLGWMKDRLIEMHRILRPTGTIYLHIDWHASHYLKVEMDKIFGYNNFRDEIIWSFSKVGGTTKKFLKWHETIFRYSKTNVFTFNMDEVRESYSESLLESLKEDDGGKYYTRGLGTDPSVKRNKKTYINPKGKVPGDVWNICQYAAPKKERLGYPTQKPEALLERIIKVSSNQNDIILDPFCGCGTSLAVSDRLNRRYIGIDISPKACKVITTRRLQYSSSEIIGLPTNVNDLVEMKPHEFQQWVCDKMLAKNTSRSKHKPSGGDGGKDGIVRNNLITSGGYGGTPIQIKQSDGVGVNVIKNLFATMHDMKVKKGFVVALSFGSGAIEQVSIYKLEDSVDIKLIKAEDLCNIPNYNFHKKAIQKLEA